MPMSTGAYAVLFTIQLCLVHVSAKVILSQQMKNALEHDLKINVHKDNLHREQLKVEGYKKGAKTYDFIVVGSGSAGSVIANRLSENPRWRILLLEAGIESHNIETIPVIAPMCQMTRHNWGYFMEKQEGIGRGLKDQRIPLPRGKALGGSTVINYMVYARGHEKDYDKWSATGITGWSFKEVLPYFLKSEKAHNLRLAEPKFHNTEGLLSVSDSYQSPLVKSFLQAGNELGYPTIDYTMPRPLGFSTVQSTTFNGRRQSVAQAFLNPITNRKNLYILTSCYVTKVLIDPSTKITFGVEYQTNGKKYIAIVTKEVILSAGALDTPKILMLSGIGPKKHLQDLGIEVIEDLPVGQNLHDHNSYIGLNFLVNDSVTMRMSRIFSAESVSEFVLQGSGPLTSIGGVEGIAFIKTNISKDEDFDYPDVELMFMGGSVNTDYGLVVRRILNIADDVYEKFWKPLEGNHVWTIVPVLLHPKSRGYIHLKSKNPFDQAKFYGNYFTDPDGEDMRTMIAAIRFVIRLSKTKAFQRFDSKLSQIPVPGCEQYESDSDQYWECAIRSLSLNLYHQAGTCKMGNDKTSVVDSELKVHGIQRLRVSDASVIPFGLSGHNNAPTIMIGEKAADYIKMEWT